MNITEAIEKLKEEELAETHTLHWLHYHGHGDDFHDDEFNYCYNCAKSIYDFLIGVAEKPVARYLDIPDWKDCSEKNTEIREDWEYNTYDTSQFCHMCACILEVPLTNDGLECELNHFESIEEIKSPEDKRQFLNMLEEIIYVEDENFLSEFYTIDEINEARQLHKRTIELLSKLL